ncbi:phenylacetate--CoA ligase family protein [Thermoplasmatota archaeon]
MKSYFIDIDNLRRLDEDKLRRYRDKKFRKIIRYAFSVPMYRELYSRAGIEIEDIKGLDDITKLPVISKEDVKKYFPDGLIPEDKNKENLVTVSTSGTTGKSLSIYVDMFDIIMGLFGYLRTVGEYGLNWRKHRLSIIGDFAPHTAETGYVKKSLFSNAWFQSYLKNLQWLDTNEKPEKVIEEMDSFKPDFIGGYTGMLGHLAVLKEAGLGKNINPRVIASTGAVLDPFLKKFISENFNAPVFEVYGTTETGPIAFQCKEFGKYHIMSDLLHVEFIENNQIVASKEPGHVLVTKLYGGGTPIIRYNAINDVVSPLYEKHNCGLSGDLIEKIYGRDSIFLYRKDGKKVLAMSITGIFSKLLYELKTSKFQDIKVIQHDVDKFEIQAVIDEKLRSVPPSADEIFSVLIKGFKDYFGRDIEVETREVKKVSRKEPRIITKVDLNNIKFNGYV